MSMAIEKDRRSFLGNRFHIQEMDDWVFTSEAANDRLTKHFETRNLKGFGVESYPRNCGCRSRSLLFRPNLPSTNKPYYTFVAH